MRTLVLERELEFDLINLDVSINGVAPRGYDIEPVRFAHAAFGDNQRALNRIVYGYF
tara:strand:- start:6543 stop:6713 length:171 start_codon:yes stop_codon:yes gene_type:complete